MTDPYAALGVSQTASEEEITQAYRKLAKKYHPDMNRNDKSAEKRMQEINAAYEQIKRQKAGGGDGDARQPASGGRGYGYGSAGRPGGGQPGGPYAQWDSRGDAWDPFGDFFGGAWGRQSQQRGQAGSPYMQAVRNCVVNSRFADAINLLSSISERSAEWYFYSAIANAGLGNRVTAHSHAREAVEMDPFNEEYRSFLAQLERGGDAYRQTG
ncbi:MAG: DnaJ domain-containing protein, partial [Clostridiales bacterium]|nr:DnaJ domain-containing protein [Clostridiales bacterium]